MTYTFTKEVLKDVDFPGVGSFEQCNLYKVFNDNTLLGQFICSQKVAFISTGDYLLRIDIEKYFFKANKFEVFDVKSNAKIGQYKLPEWVFKEIGSLSLNGLTYKGIRERSNIRNNLFNRATWGNFKLRLQSDVTEVIYNIKVDTRWIEAANSEFRNAKGDIQASDGNIALILAGFFLVERMLNLNDDV